MRILVVEDDANMAGLLEKGLTEEEHVAVAIVVNRCLAGGVLFQMVFMLRN